MSAFHWQCRQWLLPEATIPIVPVSSGRVVHGRVQNSKASPDGKRIGPRRPTQPTGWVLAAAGCCGGSRGGSWLSSLRRRRAGEGGGAILSSEPRLHEFVARSSTRAARKMPVTERAAGGYHA